jgi:hypothetical protein
LARAKRTDRTEARRRRRDGQESVATAGAAAAATAVAPSGRAAPKAADPASPARPGIVAAFRGSFRPLDLQGDLRALPRLLVHWSFWGPALATLAATVVFIVWSQRWTPGAPADTVGSFSWLALQMFVYPVPAPVGAAFIAGFGARRASWLIGILIGVIASVCYAIAVYTVPVGLLITNSQDAQAAALSALLVAPVGSALFASAAAWYKRFLNIANPNRNAPRRGQAAQRPQQGRGDIKRDRLSH